MYPSVSNVLTYRASIQKKQMAASALCKPLKSYKILIKILCYKEKSPRQGTWWPSSPIAWV